MLKYAKGLFCINWYYFFLVLLKCDINNIIVFFKTILEINLVIFSNTKSQRQTERQFLFMPLFSMVSSSFCVQWFILWWLIIFSLLREISVAIILEYDVSQQFYFIFFTHFSSTDYGSYFLLIPGSFLMDRDSENSLFSLAFKDALTLSVLKFSNEVLTIMWDLLSHCDMSFLSASFLNVFL